MYREARACMGFSHEQRRAVCLAATQPGPLDGEGSSDVVRDAMCAFIVSHYTQLYARLICHNLDVL